MSGLSRSNAALGGRRIVDELISNVIWDKDKRSGKMILANGKTATLEIDVGNDEPIPESTLNSVKFVLENEPQIRHKIAASVMANYKDWCDDDITTPEELAQKINLADVTFWDDGGGSLYYYPERDMFTGHSICAFFEANGVIGEAEMAG
jgi:hypothetical protein